MNFDWAIESFLCKFIPNVVLTRLHFLRFKRKPRNINQPCADICCQKYVVYFASYKNEGMMRGLFVVLAANDIMNYDQV